MDNHKKHVYKHVQITSQYDITLEGIVYLPHATVEEWLKLEPTQQHLHLYPNAVKAKKLKESKLYKAMK